jgi:hypothetical protein
MTSDNGGSLTGEPDLSDLLETEVLLFLFNGMERTGDTITTMVSSEHTDVKHTKRSDGSMEDITISEILDTDASMFNLTTMLIIDMLCSTNAREERVVDGRLPPRDTTIQNTHSPTESNSKSDQECTETRLSSGTSILEDINTDLESKLTIQLTRDNGLSSTQELRLLDQS